MPEIQGSAVRSQGSGVRRQETRVSSQEWEELSAQGGLLDQELSRLPDHYRSVIVLCDLEGMTRKETARQLGIPEGSVASRLARARVMLAKLLTRRGFVFTGWPVAAVLSAASASASAPPAVVAATIQAATLVATGKAAASGVISAKVAAITEGMVKAMFVTKLKSVSAIVLVVAALAGAAGLIYQSQAAEQLQAMEPKLIVNEHNGKVEKPMDVGQRPAQPKQQPAKSDRERMVGNWFIMNDDSKRKGEMWVITEDRILMRAKNLGLNAHLCTHRLDAAKDPNQIDITVTKVNGPPIGIIKGIYALDGDELRLCLGDLGKNRPTAFPKEPMPGEVLILQRAAPGGGRPKAKEEQPAANMQPKNETAQWLFGQWQNHTRTGGKIPGALIGQLTLNLDLFLKQYPDDKNAPALAALRPRIDASKDWTQPDAVALLDDITAISTTLVGWTNLKLTLANMRNFKQGQPLPAELKSAAWGAPEANGLRAAWLLEPVAKEYALGTVLKARVLFHNTGKEPVVFTTETNHLWDQHTARDAKGNEIKVSRSFTTGLIPKVTYRLAPGEYAEVLGQKIGIGAGSGTDIPAQAGDEITLSHRVDATFGARSSDPQVWKTGIAARVEREGPMPKTVADREQLIRRVTLDLFGVPASAQEIAAFVGDNAGDALAKLTERLQAKPRIEPWAGHLPTGETKFRVTAADAK